MTDPTVIRVMDDFKRGLTRREAVNLGEMLRRWQQVEGRLAARMEALADEIARGRAAGQITSAGQLVRQERYQALMLQVRAEVERYQAWLTGRLTVWQQEAWALGLDQSTEAIYATGLRGTFNIVPVTAVEYMAGLTADGSPFFDLLRRRALWPEAVDGLTRTLTDAITMGWSPRKTASRMADGLADGLEKARVIARTEQMRVYRTAATAQYRESGVVRAQMRVAAKSQRTCLACLAADGEILPLNAPVPDHPQGRCVGVPWLIGRDAPEWQHGSEWFAAQPTSVQREMMGDKMYEAWHAGAFKFSELRHATHNDTWGDGLRPATLAELGIAGRGEVSD